jgi:acyl-coenzyme A thioesterase 9
MFGGYLMREAFDISLITANLQCPGKQPVLLRVDQVLFLKPVTVGSVMDLQSKVTLIEEIEGIGKVMRVVTKGYNEHKVQTNNFNFLFVVRDKDFDRQVMPETFEDMLEFHEAKRRLSYERILIG